jgi:dTDP-4-amino-4,6-dideoxygalactose transaminase
MGDAPWAVALADVTVGEEERAAVDEVLRSGWLSMGPRTEAFEASLAEYLGAKRVLAVSNGTAALHLAAAALGLGPGDEVIVPSLTFVASAAGVRQTGADVVLADSTSLDDFAIPASEVVRLSGERTRAVVVLHYGGYPADMGALTVAAAERGLFVIEDAAHAIGASLDGTACGLLGAAGCFSFFPNKNMTTGEGGAVAFEDDSAAERAARMRSHAMTTLTWDRHRGHASSYDVTGVGFNYRIDEIRAAIGIVQLAKLPAMNAARARLADDYRRLLDGSERVKVPTQGGRGVSAHHLSTIVAETPALRDEIRERLRRERVQTSLHYPSIGSFSAYSGRDEPTPVADEIAARALTLPLHPLLTTNDVELICETVLRTTGEA